MKIGHKSEHPVSVFGRKSENPNSAFGKKLIKLHHFHHHNHFLEEEKDIKSDLERHRKPIHHGYR
jgi:superoxide dismutase